MSIENLSSNDHEIYLSVVIPSYKSAQLLSERMPILIQYLDNLEISYEIIIVDDGSLDNGETKKIVQDLNCQYISNSKNMGKGASVRKGMLQAKGKYRIFTDADLPYDLSSIKQLLWFLDSRGFHFIAGDRTLPETSYFDQIPFLRRIGSHVLSFLIGRFLAGGWFDTQCGLKGFQDHVAEDLFGVGRINRFAFDIELIYIALKRNYDIKRLPVHLEYQGESTVNIIQDGLLILFDLVRIRWNQFIDRYLPQSPIQLGYDDYHWWDPKDSQEPNRRQPVKPRD